MKGYQRRLPATCLPRINPKIKHDAFGSLLSKGPIVHYRDLVQNKAISHRQN